VFTSIYKIDRSFWLVPSHGVASQHCYTCARLHGITKDAVHCQLTTQNCRFLSTGTPVLLRKRNSQAKSRYFILCPLNSW
jgi:hypothetical protein